MNLQLANIKGSDGNRKGKEYEPAKPAGENTEEQGGDLPTSYCKIMLNDQLVRTIWHRENILLATLNTS